MRRKVIVVSESLANEEINEKNANKEGEETKAESDPYRFDGVFFLFTGWASNSFGVGCHLRGGFFRSLFLLWSFAYRFVRDSL